MKKPHHQKNLVGLMMLFAIVAFIVLSAAVTDLLPYSKCKEYNDLRKSTYCDIPQYTPFSNVILLTGLGSVIAVLLIGVKIARTETPRVAKKPLKRTPAKRRK